MIKWEFKDLAQFLQKQTDLFDGEILLLSHRKINTDNWLSAPQKYTANEHIIFLHRMKTSVIIQESDLYTQQHVPHDRLAAEMTDFQLLPSQRCWLSNIMPLM